MKLSQQTGLLVSLEEQHLLLQVEDRIPLSGGLSLRSRQNSPSTLAEVYQSVRQQVQFPSCVARCVAQPDTEEDSIKPFAKVVRAHPSGNVIASRSTRARGPRPDTCTAAVSRPGRRAPTRALVLLMPVNRQDLAKIDAVIILVRIMLVNRRIEKMLRDNIIPIDLAALDHQFGLGKAGSGDARRGDGCQPGLGDLVPIAA